MALGESEYNMQHGLVRQQHAQVPLLSPLHLLNREKPDTLQTTPASTLAKESSHTVPQVSLTHTSTLPLLTVGPPTSLTDPWLQTTAAYMNSEQSNDLHTSGIIYDFVLINLFNDDLVAYFTLWIEVL